LLNTTLIDILVPYILKYVNNNEDFIKLLNKSTSYKLLFESELDLEIKFGTTYNTINSNIFTITMYDIHDGLKYDTQYTEKYVEKYKDIFTNIYFTQGGYTHINLKIIQKIFNLNQIFFEQNNFPKKFKEILLESDNNTLLNYKDWIDTFLEIVRLNNTFFTEDICKKMFDYPYEIQRLFVINGYLNLEYFDSYNYYKLFDTLSVNITNDDITQYIVSNKIFRIIL
jgi:hypothetical protein